ncbi:MAG: helix-turn-helix domain-containing protein [Alphaproteobacteria bacterium]|nr:helix-turn-helix domain-containing protein [Alphaproteobacteria bacterium]
MNLYEPQAYDIATFCRVYSISRSFAYLEIKAGRLRPFKAGRKTLISREAAEAWRRALEDASPVKSRPVQVKIIEAPPLTSLGIGRDGSS